MTDITLTAEQIQKVLDEHVELEPADTPEPTPTPKPKPKPKPKPGPHTSPAPQGRLSFTDVWGRRLSTTRSFYSNRNIYNRHVGTSYRIQLPAMHRNYRLKITDVETAGSNYSRYGVLSWHRDFAQPFIDARTWGVGGGVSVILTPDDSGRVLYFNHQNNSGLLRWWSTLQATFRAAR